VDFDPFEFLLPGDGSQAALRANGVAGDSGRFERGCVMAEQGGMLIYKGLDHPVGVGRGDGFEMLAAEALAHALGAGEESTWSAHPPRSGGDLVFGYPCARHPFLQSELGRPGRGGFASGEAFSWRIGAHPCWAIPGSCWLNTPRRGKTPAISARHKLTETRIFMATLFENKTGGPPT